jgi:hypothetical protein
MASPMSPSDQLTLSDAPKDDAPVKDTSKLTLTSDSERAAPVDPGVGHEALDDMPIGPARDL